MIKNIVRKLNTLMQNNLLRLLLPTGGIFLIAGIDLMTGYELQFFVFYYIPVFIAASRSNKVFTYGIAIACSLVWLSVDILSHHLYVSEWYRFWNTLIRAASFIIIVELFFKLRRSSEKLRQLYDDLVQANTQVKVLQGIIPICASCKRIRDGNGKWEQMESYIHRNSEADFTHGLCPECTKRLYPEYHSRLDGNNKPEPS